MACLQRLRQLRFLERQVCDLKKTFGEATENEKNAVSHRGRAVEKLKLYLRDKNPNFDRTLVFNKK